MENSPVLLRIFALTILAVPAYFWWELWSTRRWPTTKARVIELEQAKPPGILSWLSKSYSGPDLGIEYEVDGTRFVKNPNIEGQTTAGFHRSYFSVVPTEFDVRYHPDDPDRYSLVHAYKPSVFWGTGLACSVIGAGLIWKSLGGP